MAMGASDRRTLLTIFCLFIMKVSAQEDPAIEVLDLAEEAFDDQYLGCQRAMESKLEAKQVLNAEKEKSKLFQRAWNEAERRWHNKIKDCVRSILPKGFHDLHGVALVTYSGFVRDYFNKALRSAGKSYSYYMDNFHYKALHYYLTVALQLLSKGCRDNFDPLYRGFEYVVYRVPNGTVMVKFGHFLRTSEDQHEEFYTGNDTFFTLHSCSAVPIERFSEFPKEKEVVVSGNEVFTITDNGNNEYYLESTGKQCSNFNCAYIRGESSKQSVEHCINSAPPGTAFRSVSAALVTALVAAGLIHL